ncbi:unnamed protein product [Choristocarpus tenellus]
MDIEGTSNGSRSNGTAKVGGEEHDNFPFHRSELVRVISSCLNGMGYSTAAQALEAESGFSLQPSGMEMLSRATLDGDWGAAIALLPSVQVCTLGRREGQKWQAWI